MGKKKFARNTKCNTFVLMNKKQKAKALGVFSFRMDAKEYKRANDLCLKKYRVSLATFNRTLILNHFPDAKSKTNTDSQG